MNTKISPISKFILFIYLSVQAYGFLFCSTLWSCKWKGECDKTSGICITVQECYCDKWPQDGTFLDIGWTWTGACFCIQLCLQASYRDCGHLTGQFKQELAMHLLVLPVKIEMSVQHKDLSYLWGHVKLNFTLSNLMTWSTREMSKLILAWIFIAYPLRRSQRHNLSRAHMHTNILFPSLIFLVLVHWWK